MVHKDILLQNMRVVAGEDQVYVHIVKAVREGKLLKQLNHTAHLYKAVWIQEFMIVKEATETPLQPQWNKQSINTFNTPLFLATDALKHHQDDPRLQGLHGVAALQD